MYRRRCDAMSGPTLRSNMDRLTALGTCRLQQQLDLRRLRCRRSARRGHLHADRDRQAQRRRSADLADRCAGAPAGSPGQAHRRIAALVLETAAPQQARRLNAAFRAGATLQQILPRPSPDAYLTRMPPLQRQPDREPARPDEDQIDAEEDAQPVEAGIRPLASAPSQAACFCVALSASALREMRK